MFKRLKLIYYKLLRKKRIVQINVLDVESIIDPETLELHYRVTLGADVKTMDGRTISTMRHEQLAPGDTLDINTVTELKL